jgi:ribosome biogenesis GTPase
LSARTARASDALAALGWSDSLAAEFEPHRELGLEPGRVAVQHRGVWIVHGDAGEVRAGLAGRLLHEAASPADLPVVGDWVAYADTTIHALLARRTAFIRRGATGPGGRIEEQVLAANVDVCFLVSALGPDFNPRRLERFLALAWASGAEPVIVLTKADLHDDPARVVAEAEAIGWGVPVLAVSNVTGQGLDQLTRHLDGNRSGALLGSSGVGKSTLVNRLTGRDLATQELRRDGRGRHTTTHRELVMLPGGGILIDTPGLRELALWDARDGVETVFPEIDELAAKCRFRDCAHEREPGCAVKRAAKDGRLDEKRLAAWRKLKHEVGWLEQKETEKRRRGK